MDKEKQIFKFSVIDNKTGKYPDLYNIALKEDWAKGLMYCDMEGFSINEDGQLILSDECGKFVYCPSDRFTVVFEDSVVLSRELYNEMVDDVKVSKEKLVRIIDSAKDKERKETAEKWYNKVKELYLENVGEQVFEHNWFGVQINKFAKQFGIEIKE